MVNKINPNWGGKRPGAGRKSTCLVKKVCWSAKVTPTEREFLKDALRKYREEHTEEYIAQ